MTNGLPYSFARLLREVAKVDGLKRLRFTTSHPKDLSDELISCFAEIDKLCPQFHLPVQSGSDAVLRRMNRKYTITDYRQKVEKLLDARPDLALTTDIIVGFPGETDEDFQQTLDLLEAIRYHGSFSFKYSDRPGIKACHLDGKIEEHIKGERLQMFQKRQDEISLERNREYIGKSLMILVESADNNKLAGRTVTNHIVHAQLLPAQVIRPGEFVETLITSAGQHSLKADLLPAQ
jgi:tRNA-2-methylthio-N6-dimethylallyladenosine synthase